MGIYQISTLQALAMGYTRSVVTVEELLKHGDTGLGTFEDVAGEMIVVDGVCYQAMADGSVRKARIETGIPFAAVAESDHDNVFEVSNISTIDQLSELLTLKIEEGFGLNGMHVARVDGHFSTVSARSAYPYRSQHIDLKTILSETQRSFVFEDIDGTLVCIYFPDYMDGINLPGWHIHFISSDRSVGGHVFDLEMVSGEIQLTRLDKIEIQLPNTPAFDTYSLTKASENDIAEIEQGKA